MAEYISRDTFLEQQRAWYCKDCNMRKNTKGKTVYEIGEAPCRACDIGTMLDAVEDYPAADVVERKAGRWLPIPNVKIKNWKQKCSVCGLIRRGKTTYCPECGAKMIGGDEDV